MALRLIEHDVAQKPSRAKICVAVQNGAHQIGCAEQALHQEIGFAARDAGDGLLRACSVGIRIDDAEFRRSFAELFQKSGDLVPMADQDRLRDVLALGGADGPKNVLVVRSGDGNASGAETGGPFEQLRNGSHAVSSFGS